jgi:hypothetical protein
MRNFLLILFVIFILIMTQAASVLMFSSHGMGGVLMSTDCPFSMMMAGDCVTDSNNALSMFDHHVGMLRGILLASLITPTLIIFGGFLLFVVFVKCRYRDIRFLTKFTFVRQGYYWRYVVYTSWFRFLSWMVRQLRPYNFADNFRVYMYS